MPIYEYHCTKCQKTFERFQKITEGPLKRCPDCGGEVKRLISETSFSLRGGGWYKDGYSAPATKAEGKKNEKNKDKSKNETKTQNPKPKNQNKS